MQEYEKRRVNEKQLRQGCKNIEIDDAGVELLRT